MRTENNPDLRFSKPSPKHASSLLKALDVLSVLAINPDGMAMNDLRHALKQPRTSLLRILQTLEHYGLVAQKSRLWKVTPQFHRWSDEDPAGRLKERHRERLEALSKAVQELVVLGVVEGGRLRHLDYVEWEHQLVVRPGLGRRFPLEQSAMGKLYLSQRLERLKLLEPLAKRSEIIEAGSTGVAWNREEIAPGIIAMAFWVEPASPVAPMVSISWPRSRFSEAAAERAVEAARNLWDIGLQR